MEKFFTDRVLGFDEHILSNIEGCKEGYINMAQAEHVFHIDGTSIIIATK